MVIDQKIISTTNQFNREGKLTHLLTLEGMPKEQILYILNTAKQFVSVTAPFLVLKVVTPEAPTDIV